MSILGQLCMDANQSNFIVQKAVIPLKKALTKLFKCYFMTKVLFNNQNFDFFCPAVKVLKKRSLNIDPPLPN